MNTLKRRADLNEKGFASLVVASVLILVLSLTTIGFVQLMRSNQQTALNKQLSDQAYYAAESGVNDAAQAYAAGYSLPKTACPSNTDTSITNTQGVDVNLPGYNYLTNPSVNTSTETGVTCLLVDPTPQSIQYTVYPSQPTVVEMQGCTTTPSTDPTRACGSGTGTAVGKVNISWNDIINNKVTSPGLAPARCSNFQSDPSWPNQNLLRIELVPLPTTGNITRQSLVSSSYTAFLCPDNSAPSGVTYVVNGDTGVNSGSVLSSYCTPVPGSSGSNPPHRCYLSLDVSSINDNAYFLIMRGIYNTPIQTNITLSGAAGPLNIGDAQILVDSTGKAQNVLKRIQTRVPENNEYTMPNAVVQGEVCKQLELLPSSQNTFNNSTDYTPCNASFRAQLTP